MCVCGCVNVCVYVRASMCVRCVCMYVHYVCKCVRMCGYVCESYVDMCVVFMREYDCQIGCAYVCMCVCVFVCECVCVRVSVCVVYMSVCERESMRSVSGCQGLQV